MKTYKAEIYFLVELENGKHTFDRIDTIKASTLIELQEKLNRQYDLTGFEVFENRLEFSREIATEKELYETYSIYLSEVIETELDASIILTKELNHVSR